MHNPKTRVSGNNVLKSKSHGNINLKPELSWRIFALNPNSLERQYYALCIA